MKNFCLPTIKIIAWRYGASKKSEYPIKLRVTHHRRSRYLPTGEMADASEIKRDGSLVEGPKLKGLVSQVAALEELLCELPIRELDEMSVEEVVDYLSRADATEPFSLDFLAYGRKIALQKTGGSQRNYLTALKDFSAFVGSENFAIEKVTSSLLRAYEVSIRSRLGATARAVSLYTSAIAYIHRRAREEFNNEELGEIRIRNPYSCYRLPRQPEAIHRAIELSTLRKMYQTRHELTGRMRVGVDVFLLSFALMGANLPDLYEAKRPKDGVLVYNRAKTRSRRRDRAEARVRLEAIALEVASDYLAKSGDKAFDFYERYSDYKVFGGCVNKGLKAWAKCYGEDYSSVYSARHTWATTAYEAGVNPAIITDGLVHRDPSRRMDDIYVRKSWTRLWDENRRVLAYALPAEELIAKAQTDVGR